MNLKSIAKTLSLRPLALKHTTLGCGAAGLGLYRLLYAIGVDGRGLVVSSHPAWIALCILSAALGVLVLISTASYPGTGGRFPRSVAAFVGCVLAAVSSVLTGLSCLHGGYLLYAVPAFLAAAAFAGLAFCRIRGLKAHFLLHVVICIHFALQLLKVYQFSSFDPLIQNHLFQLLACIALMVTAYQLAAFDLDRGSSRWLWTSGLAAVYLCLVSLGSSSTCLYLTGAVWAITTLPMPQRSRQTMTQRVEKT